MESDTYLPMWCSALHFSYIDFSFLPVPVMFPTVPSKPMEIDTESGIVVWLISQMGYMRSGHVHVKHGFALLAYKERVRREFTWGVK